MPITKSRVSSTRIPEESAELVDEVDVELEAGTGVVGMGWFVDGRGDETGVMLWGVIEVEDVVFG